VFSKKAVANSFATAFFLPSNRGHAFQFDGNRRGQPINTDRGAARLIFPKIFSVNAVEYLKVALHVYQKNSHIHQILPARTTGFKHCADIAKHRMYLRLKIKFHIIACRAAHQSGDSVALRVARPDAREKQKIAHAARVRIEADGFWGIRSVYFFHFYSSNFG
jgi:hypothetical protein